MNRTLRLASAMTLGLCPAALGQELVTYTLSWSEVVAGTAQPVASPNGVINPGEGVRLVIRVAISPEVGATATYTPPPPPGFGTIAGLGSIFFDLLGTNLNGGTWSNLSRLNLGGIIFPGKGLGDPLANGNIINCQAGQFVTPGSTANGLNPIDNLWRGTCTPGSYAVRNASIAPAGAVAAAGNHSAILIQYGIDGSGNPRYIAKFVAAAFNGTGSIPIVPSPAGAALIGLAMTVGRARRRAATVDREA